MSEKLHYYNELEQFFSDRILAMTQEDLDMKSDIPNEMDISSDECQAVKTVIFMREGENKMSDAYKERKKITISGCFNCPFNGKCVAFKKLSNKVKVSLALSTSCSKPFILSGCPLPYDTDNAPAFITEENSTDLIG